MNGALPDVNVLLAFAWPNHQFYAAARRWYLERGRDRWSTCAITQLGFIRLSSNPAFTPYAKTPLEAVLLFRQWVEQPNHSFVDHLPAPVDGEYEKIAARLQGYRQTTDAYLAWVAKRHGLRLVTFDRRLAGLASPEVEVELLSTEP